MRKILDGVIVVCKKGASKVKEAGIKTAVAIGSAVGLTFGATPAKADFTTDIATLETQITTALSSLSGTQVAVMGSVFGLIALAIGFGWIVKTSKAK